MVIFSFHVCSSLLLWFGQSGVCNQPCIYGPRKEILFFPISGTPGRDTAVAPNSHFGFYVWFVIYDKTSTVQRET